MSAIPIKKLSGTSPDKIWHILSDSFSSKHYKYHKPLYISVTRNYTELLSQYYNTVFSLRRIELNVSDALVSQDKEYLLSIPLSCLAVECILNKERFLLCDFWEKKNPTSDIQKLITQLKYMLCHE